MCHISILELFSKLYLYQEVKAQNWLSDGVLEDSSSWCTECAMICLIISNFCVTYSSIMKKLIKLKRKMCSKTSKLFITKLLMFWNPYFSYLCKSMIRFSISLGEWEQSKDWIQKWVCRKRLTNSLIWCGERMDLFGKMMMTRMTIPR